MAMVTAKGIPTGAPVLDATAVWTPPHIGPLDGMHMWLAHTLRGADVASGVKRLPDMIGGTDLVSAATAAQNGFVDDPTAPIVVVKDGYGKLSANLPVVDNTDSQTWLAVLNPAATPRTRNLQIGGYGNVDLNGGTVKAAGGATTLGAIPTNALSVLVLKCAGGVVTAYVNGAQLATTAAVTKSTVLTVALGGYQAVVSDEKFACLKQWTRALTTGEITAATTDAKTLFGIV